MEQIINRLILNKKCLTKIKIINLKQLILTLEFFEI